MNSQVIRESSHNEHNVILLSVLVSKLNYNHSSTWLTVNMKYRYEVNITKMI